MLKKKARNARKRPFHSKGVRKAPTHRRSYKACTKYHDYYTTITIPEHVGTRSVCISMNDILCPEVNFNPSFVVPGCRFLERPDLGHYDTHVSMMQNSDDPVSKATRDYKFLMRKADEYLSASESFNGMEIHTKQMERRFKSNENLMRGNVLRLTRGTYNHASDIRGGVIDVQYKNNNFSLAGPSVGGSIETRHVGLTGSDTEQYPQSNCAVLGSICKGNYFIPRNGALEYHLNQTRSFDSDPAIRKTMVLPSGEMSYKVGFDGTGIHGAFLVNNIAGTSSTGNPFESIARNKTLYQCGGATAFGLGFRPDCLPGYVPSFPEVKDRTLACALTLNTTETPVVQPGGETDAPLINLVDLTDEMDGLWRNLSGRDQSEIMRCIALTKVEVKELLDGRPEIRSQLAGGTAWDLRPPHMWCHDNLGVFVDAQHVGPLREAEQFEDFHDPATGSFNRVEMSTLTTPLKKIIQEARGVGEMVKLFDHSMVVGSKMDIELIGTGVKDRAIINENGVNVVMVGQGGASDEIDIKRKYNNDASYTPRIKCEWGVQKCYPKNEDDFGIPTFKAEDTHERLPAMGERVDPFYNYSHFYDNMTIDECEGRLHMDYKNKTRKDMFKLRGHVVDAQTLRGKTKLSSKYDMNSSIKRYRIYYPDGTKKADGNKRYDQQPALLKDPRYVINHRAVEADQENLHTAESIVNLHSDYDPIAQQSKNYDMREKYMPVFRVFTRRASTKDLKIVERQTKSDFGIRGQMHQTPQNIQNGGGIYALRGGIMQGGHANAGAGDGNLDAVRLGEMAPLSNHARFSDYLTDHIYAGGNYALEDGESKVDSTDVKIDGPKWNGVIDSERRRHLSHKKTPAMTFRVRVRYKVRWWNSKETNPVVPFEDSKRIDVQQSTFEHTSMNNDFISMTNAHDGSSKLEDMEDEDIHNAQSRKRRREHTPNPTESREKFSMPMTDIEKRQFLFKLRKTIPDTAMNRRGTGVPHVFTVQEVEELSKKGSFGDYFINALNKVNPDTINERVAGVTKGNFEQVAELLKEAEAPAWAQNAATLVAAPAIQKSLLRVLEFWFGNFMEFSM